MKKIIHLSAFLLTSIFTFGQSVLLTPDKMDQRGGANDNIYLRNANDGIPNIVGIKHEGSFTTPTPTLNGTQLLGIVGGGYGTFLSSQKVGIYFNASENWSGTANGTNIRFLTTTNGTTASQSRMIIDNMGKVGIGNLSPSGKLHINHLASSAAPSLHLQSTGSSSSIIKATSTSAGEWENHFLTNASAASNLVYWTNSINSATPLILTGEGDIAVERNATINGFTRLGDNVTNPKIKIKKLSGTFSANANISGTATNIAHGVASAAKVISISVLGQYAGSGGYVSNSFLTSNGYQFDYQIDGVNIIVTPKQGNSASLVSQNIKIVITYEE